MGVGRFAFTPMLPLMMRDGLLNAAGGAELAAANYAGYLLGALSAAAASARVAARWPGRPLAWVLGSLLAVVWLTAAMAWAQAPLAWLLLRALAGLFSAWALVGIGAWAMPALAAAGLARADGWLFAGVGLGISAAGGLVWWWASALAAPALWLALAALAALLLVAMGGVLRQAGPPGAAAASQPGQQAPQARQTEQPQRPQPAMPAGAWPLVVCYGSFGFGYILPATFLPVMARALVDDARWFGLAWPLFGLAAAASTLLSSRFAAGWPRQRLWALCQAAMALGVALPIANRSGASIALAALLVGGSFMVATMAAMQLARTWAPHNATPLLGRMTAAFALGQIAGPLVVRGLAAVAGAMPAALQQVDAITLTSASAALLLAVTAAWLWRGLPAPRG